MLMTRTIHATELICSLPSIPTYNWSSLAAQALAQISPIACTGVIIAQIDTTNYQAPYPIMPLSTGISGNPLNEGSGNYLNIHDAIERLKYLDLKLPAHWESKGLICALSLLNPRWASTTIAKPFIGAPSKNSPESQCPIIAIIPIDRSHPGFVLIAVIAMGASQDQTSASKSANLTTKALATLTPLLSRKAHAALKEVTNPKAWLTDREHEILDQLIVGHSVRVIAENLDRSAHTVHDHVKNLHKKLGASSRGELIATALGHPIQPKLQHTPAPDPIVLTSASLLSELKPTAQAACQPPSFTRTTKAVRLPNEHAD